jgi:2'-5' RNA ligase
VRDATHARLFVALPLPGALRNALARLAPAAAPGIRPQNPADLHVTLHFLGMADIASVKPALARVVAQPFTATLTLPGQFFSKGHPRTLFVGVAPDSPLRALHAAAGRQLADSGFALDTKPFVPHITLARLNEGANAAPVAAYLRQSLPLEATHFNCTEFALYASETLPEGARYRVLERYPLA